MHKSARIKDRMLSSLSYYQHQTPTLGWANRYLPSLTYMTNLQFKSPPERVLTRGLLGNFGSTPTGMGSPEAN